MNYPANTHQWKVGNFVIHDADAKRAEMLMEVLGYDRETGLCRTKYLHPGYYDGMRKATMLNELRFLHDPAQFGIVTTSEVL